MSNNQVWMIIGCIFVLVAGYMIGHANASMTQQRIELSIECIKVGGNPVIGENGAFECRKNFEKS